MERYSLSRDEQWCWCRRTTLPVLERCFILELWISAYFPNGVIRVVSRYEQILGHSVSRRPHHRVLYAEYTFLQETLDYAGVQGMSICERGRASGLSIQRCFTEASYINKNNHYRLAKFGFDRCWPRMMSLFRCECFETGHKYARVEFTGHMWNAIPSFAQGLKIS